MFEDATKEPEDVFAQTDAAAPQMAPPTMSPAPQLVSDEAPITPVAAPSVAPAPASQTEVAEKRPFPWKLVVLFVAIVVVVGLAFFLSMRILNSRTPVTPSAPEETTQPTATTEIPAAVTPPVVETQLGTNPNNPDTDADGLFDKEEVDVYQTNPLNPDTDGDTYKDGDEVKNGYNPSGPGKLLQIPQK